MFVTVGTREFRVQYVYSARDIKTSRALEVPGTLRQFVDNLAASIRRRVALAEISRVERIEGLDPISNLPIVSYVPVAQGFAICHWQDNFSKVEARGRALYRALKLAKTDLTAEEKDGIAGAAEFGDYETLKANFAN